ncbi:MAG: FprA family A-type flavoprotein [Spirochaetaceae bacterium]|nr:FprA family A-type flavoprotein [Spirochaetaceae bacterium]
MKITDDILYVGVNDTKIDLFEGQYPVPNGISYNSYVIMDEKIAVMDSVDGAFGDEWLSNVSKALGGRTPDYLIVQHMEMDHSACIAQFTAAYPKATLVASKLAFVIMKNLFGTDYADRQIVISEGSTLSLGKHTLRFIAAPNVHWPEVMFTYDETTKTLFSADAFGTFGALGATGTTNSALGAAGTVGASPVSCAACDPAFGYAAWPDEARRYYIGIVGKFGEPVQAVLKKAAALDIQRICPLHGPVLTENLNDYISLYNTWSSYEPEADDIFIAFTSVYGNTKRAAEKLASLLRERGATVRIADLARTDMTHCVAEAFRCKKLVLVTTTYCNGIFPPMHTFINNLTERNFQNRTVALVENGSWNPAANKTMAAMLESCKNLTFVEPKVTIRTALNDASSAQLSALAEAIIK